MSLAARQRTRPLNRSLATLSVLPKLSRTPSQTLMKSSTRHAAYSYLQCSRSSILSLPACLRTRHLNGWWDNKTGRIRSCLRALPRDGRSAASERVRASLGAWARIGARLPRITSLRESLIESSTFLTLHICFLYFRVKAPAADTPATVDLKFELTINQPKNTMALAQIRVLRLLDRRALETRHRSDRIAVRRAKYPNRVWSSA